MVNNNKNKIKSLGRLIITNHPNETKIFSQIYKVEEHDKTYKILEKTSDSQADFDVSVIQKFVKKEKVINGQSEVSELPVSWSLGYSLWYELEDYEHLLKLVVEKISRTVNVLQKRADEARVSALRIEKLLEETLEGD